jgi:hypothetical protein
VTISDTKKRKICELVKKEFCWYSNGHNLVWEGLKSLRHFSTPFLVVHQSRSRATFTIYLTIRNDIKASG